MIKDLVPGQNSWNVQMPQVIHADFTRRLLATVADLLLLSVLLFLLKIAFPDPGNFLFFKKSSAPAPENVTGWVLSRSSLLIVWILYSMIMDCSNRQGTLGKQLMGLKVTDDYGQRISFVKSMGRNISKIISYIFLGLGFFWILFDKHKKGWHDKIANTLVVRND